MEICAIPYSSMYQPIAFTDFSDPGSMTGSPFSSVTVLPVRELPSRNGLPFSLTSYAMAFARLTEVVLRLTLKATRKSLAPTIVAPDLSLKSAGPKSGFHARSASFFLKPSYSPALMLARFLLFSSKAAYS